MGPQGPQGIGAIAPYIKGVSLDVTRNVSEDGFFSCIFLGNPIPVVNWNHNGKYVDAEKTVAKSKESMVHSTFVLRNVSWEDRGNITCKAHSVLGDASATGIVNVYVPPTLKCPKQLVYAYIGSDFIFPKCNITANPEAIIKWTRGYGPMPERRFVKHGKTMEIKNYDISDEGYYIMKVSNLLGSQTAVFQLKTKILRFKIKPAPFIVTNISTILKCVANGNQKKISGKWINFVTKQKISFKNKTSGNEMTLITTVNKPGSYECQFSDGLNKISTATYVRFTTMLLSTNNVEEKLTSVHDDDITKYGAHNCFDRKLNTECWTRYENYPWIQVDIGRKAVIDYIVLRSNYKRSEHKKYTVTVGNTGGMKNSQLCADYDTSGLSNGWNDNIQIVCKRNIMGRLIRLDMKENTNLEMYEFEVYGIPVL